jgi:hypothetical protein
MPSRRWCPKSWVTPKTPFRGEPVNVYDVLKEVYADPSGPIVARPWWAKLAHERNWISGRAYYAVEPEPTGEVGMLEMLYTESRFFKLLKKDFKCPSPLV